MNFCTAGEVMLASLAPCATQPACAAAQPARFETVSIANSAPANVCQVRATVAVVVVVVGVAGVAAVPAQGRLGRAGLHQPPATLTSF